MFTFLTEIPWMVPVGFILVGAVLLTYGNQRAHAKIRTTGLTILSLAFLLLAAGFLIDTPAEKCQRRTAAIVKAANDQDWGTLQTLLDTDTTIDLSNQGTPARGPADIRKESEMTAKKIGLKNVFVVQSHADGTDPKQIVITLSVASLQDTTQDRPFSTGWEFDYSPSSSGKMDLKSIRLLSLGTEAAN